MPMTRINLNARVGLEMQNDTFAPNTADPIRGLVGAAGFSSLNSAAAGNRPRTHPNMMAEVYQLKVSAASHPLTERRHHACSTGSTDATSA